MGLRTIVSLPDPVLRRKAKPVAKFDSNLQTLLEDMIETMRAAEGVGEAPEEMRHELGWQAADRLAREAALEDEVRPAGVGHPGVEHLGDVGMVHHGQGLFFGLEPGDDLPAVHARLDDFQGHAPLD